MDERQRLASVRELALDRIRQPEIFARITRLATDIFACPIALVSVVEEERQWFLANTGFGHDQTPRNIAFCSVCIAGEGPLLVRDAQTDPRFRDNPLVTEPGGLRSYLGIPIRAEDGALIGTVCCASDRADAFSTQDIPRLTALAGLAEQCINAHARALALGQANASLEKVTRLFHQAERAAQIGSWRLDLATDELHWSDQVFAIHGLPAGTPLDTTSAINFYEPEDRSLVTRTMKKVIKHGKPLSLEGTIRRPDGQMRRVRAVGERIDVEGKPESIAGIFIDCTEEYQRTIALQRAATRDPLTGLFNRSEFDRRLGEALAERRQRGPTCPLTVMLLDLDGFKDVNDEFGHMVGDRLLVQIAQALERAITDGAFLARWGGDEFAILFAPGHPLAEAHDCARSLITRITGQIEIGEGLVQVGATCGIAQMHDDASAAELMRRADLALYHGKANGPGEACCWSERIEASQAARKAAIAQLTQALNSGRAFAAYQPIVALENEATVGLEALLRLRDEDGRVIGASEFVPALLDPALARRVSRFMLDEVRRDAPHLLDVFGPAIRIGINVTEADLSRGDFLAVMDDLVARSVLEPANIVLEVTETMLLLDENGAIRDLLTTLDRRGFTIALDDFGTGFSSLTHLRDFPIRKVKIDKDFIATMMRDHQTRLIVQAMVQMGRSLGTRMVAEGVETDEQLTYLRAIGCSHAQGYRFARPAGIEDWRARRAALEAEAGPRQDAA